VFTEMGLTAVMSAQLWHHKYLGGGLCDLPTWSEGERDLSAPRLPEWSTVPSPFPALARA
jgi:hypothetical protein